MKSVHLVVRALSAVLGAYVAACGPGTADYAQDLGSGYTFLSDSSLHSSITRDGKLVVPSLIVDFDSDDRFIVALRLATRSHECEPGRHVFQEVTSTLEYWVVDKATHEVRVTEQEHELRTLRSEIGVSNVLEIDGSKAQEYLQRYDRLERAQQIRGGKCRLLETVRR